MSTSSDDRRSLDLLKAAQLMRKHGISPEGELQSALDSSDANKPAKATEGAGMATSLKQALGHIRPPLEEMEQWEVEKSLGVLIEGIQAKHRKAAGLEWSAKVHREDADRMAETLARYRQRLGLENSPIGQPHGQGGDDQAPLSEIDADSSGFEPFQQLRAGE